MHRTICGSILFRYQLSGEMVAGMDLRAR